MTAVMHTSTVTTAEVEALDGLSTLGAGLEDFLKDPISYGSYDFADPVTLDEFSCARHYHGRYISRLA